MGEKISARVTAKSEMGYWHVIKISVRKVLEIGPPALSVLTILLGVQPNLRWGIDMLNGGKKILRGGQLNHIIKILEEKGV